MKLLYDAGSGDSAGFANELRERSAGLLGPDAGDPVELPGGELLPGDGKALPAELARALDELESLQQSMGADLAALEPIREQGAARGQPRSDPARPQAQAVRRFG